MIKFLLEFEQAHQIMKILTPAFITIISLMFLVGSADAQRRKPVARTTAATAAAAAAEIKAGADKVAVQIKNVTKFLYALGGIASGIEQVDKDAKSSRRPDQAALDLNVANKQKVMQAIRNLRAGIAALEVEFRTKPALTKYLVQVQGITELSANCEDLAAGGHFSESGKPLLSLVEKLTDALVAIR
jgi:hypothetical protein